MTYSKFLTGYCVLITLLALGLALQNRQMKRAPAEVAGIDLANAPTHTFDLEGTPVVGDSQAPVMITVFSEFQCPHCARMASQLKQIQNEFGSSVAVAFKHFPLPYHELAPHAAAAVMAAHEQGRFEAMHDALFEIQDELSEANIFAVAESIGLDMERFQDEHQPAHWQALLARDRKEGLTAGVRGTPSLFVNGVHIERPTVQAIRGSVQFFLDHPNPTTQVKLDGI